MDDKADYIRVTCPSCQKRLRVPPKAAGQTITCPNCSGKVAVEVPQAVTQINDEDEFKFKDDPPAPTPKTKPKSSVLDNLDLSEFDLKEVAPAKKKDDFAKNEMDAIAAALKSTESSDDEFRFSCKVCGTAMYARSSEVGNMVRCPDCYAQFSVPTPPPKPQKKTVQLPKTDDISFKSPSGVTTREAEDRTAADDYLRRAEEDLKKDVKEQKSETYDFDTLGAFDKAFGYLGDSTVWILAIVPGLLLGVTVVLAYYAYNSAKDTQYRPAGIVVSIAIIAIFGIPNLSGCLANGLAILEAAANHVRKVSQWPFFHLGDAIGDIIMLLSVFSVSSIPGGVLGWFLVSAGFHSIVGIALPLMSIWFFFPIMLLGVLDNGAIMQPYSSEVVSSMKERADAWGAMYLWNAMAMSLLLLIGYFTIGKGTALNIIGTAIIPFALYFMFRQIGNLAAEISDVTNLHFESDEDEEDDDSPVKEVNRKTSNTEMY